MLEGFGQAPVCLEFDFANADINGALDDLAALLDQRPRIEEC